MLFMLLSEYVLYVLEMLQQQNTESQYEAMLSGIVGEYNFSIVFHIHTHCMHNGLNCDMWTPQ